MGKKQFGFLGGIGVFLLFLVALAIGGLFATGALASLPVLSILPAWLHVTVGWVIIVLAFIYVIWAITIAASS